MIVEIATATDVREAAKDDGATLMSRRRHNLPAQLEENQFKRPTVWVLAT